MTHAQDLHLRSGIMAFFKNAIKKCNKACEYTRAAETRPRDAAVTAAHNKYI